MRINMVFGSSSDRKKVLPGIETFVADHPDIAIRGIYASADNTPNKVRKIARELWGNHADEIIDAIDDFEDPEAQAVAAALQTVASEARERDPQVIISGAGMSNVLTGVLKGYGRGTVDLVIGVPITDSKTDGLSSILSTMEKPPRNPVLATPLNGTYTAANIAARFMNQRYDRVVVMECDLSADVEKELGKWGVPCIVSGDVTSADDLVINPFDLHGESGQDPYDLTDIKRIDRELAKGKGIQIAVKDPTPIGGGMERV